MRERSVLWVAALVLVCGAVFTGCKKSASDEYATPSAEQITRTLDTVRDRLDEIAVPRIIDSKTHEPIADLSKPIFIEAPRTVG